MQAIAGDAFLDVQGDHPWRSQLFRTPLRHGGDNLMSTYGLHAGPSERSGGPGATPISPRTSSPEPGGRAMVTRVVVGTLLLAFALAGTAAAEVSKPVNPALLETYGKLPLSFEANDGQADPQVKFLSRGRGYTLFLTSTDTVLTLTKADAYAKRRISGEATLSEPEKRAGTVLRMKLLGANPTP